MEGDVSCNLESVNIAAELINGELKDLAFRGFLKRSNALLAALNDESSNGIWIITSGLFLDKVFVESSEEERERFADVVNQNLDIVSKVVEFILSFWKNSSCQSLIGSVCDLLDMLLDCSRYSPVITAWLLHHQYPAKMVKFLKDFVKEVDTYAIEKGSNECKVACKCLDILCLCADSCTPSTLDCLELMRQLSHSNVQVLSFASKAVAGLVSSTDAPDLDFLLLTEIEVKEFLICFETKSASLFPVCVLTNLLKGLIHCRKNCEEFQKRNLVSLLQQKYKGTKLPSLDVVLACIQNSTDLSEIVLSSQQVGETFHSTSELGNEYLHMTSSFMEYFAKYTAHLDSAAKGTLTSAHFSNITAALLLTEELMSECDESQQNEMKHAISVVPGIASAASLILEHINDEGTSTLCRRAILKSLSVLMMQLTDYSAQLCRQLGTTGFVAYLLAFLNGLDVTAMLEENVAALVINILTVLLNCSKEASNLQVFEAANAAEHLVTYVTCPVFYIAILAKIILSFLQSQLSNEEFLFLNLDPEEGEYLVSLLCSATDSPTLNASGNSAVEALKFLINFTKPFENDDEIDLKRKRPVKMSAFKAKFKQRESVFESNAVMISSINTFSILEKLLSMQCEAVLIEHALHLIWNLLHLESAADIVPTSLKEAVSHLQTHAGSEVESMKFCIQYLLSGSKGTSNGFRYAKSCYLYGNFHECVEVCKDIKNQQAHEPDELADIDLLLGKAMYHTYQPQLWCVIKKGDALSQEETKLLSSECFNKMSKAISLLGSSLDREHLDPEGSKLLDLAIHSCVFDLNMLNLTGRCLLCRRGGQKLKKSHLWPNSILKRIHKDEYEGSTKPFLFGQQQQNPKSSKECIFYMFCQNCEELLSQTGEYHFAMFLDSYKDNAHEKISYGSWLFNFAVGMIFRLLSTEKLSYFLNSEEVYQCFLLCRKHLFTLSTKSEGVISAPYSDTCSYQFASMCKDVVDRLPSIYIFNCNTRLASFKDEMIHYLSEYCHCFGSVSTCRLGDAKLDLSSKVHFLTVYCNGIHFLLKFEASGECIIPDRFLVNPHPTDSQQCIMPIEELSSIPEGVWSVVRHLGAITFESRMVCYQRMQDLTIAKLTSTLQQNYDESPDAKYDVSEELLNRDNGRMLNLPSFYSFSFLPVNYDVSSSAGNRQPITLPKGHKVILHVSGRLGELSSTYLLCTNEELSFYLILVVSDESSGMLLVDGVHIILASDENIEVSKFLVEDRAGLERLPHPFSLAELHILFEKQLPHMLYSKGIKTMAQLVHLIKSRRPLDSDSAVPAIDVKCSPDGCWYCHSLCHLCMCVLPAWKGISIAAEPEEPVLKFCGEICQQLVQPKPESPPHVSATYHVKKPGKVVGPAKLQITKSILSHGAKFSSVEFIELCVNNGSEGTPVGMPYVVWQVRSVSSQSFSDFVLSSEFEPIENVWSSKLPSLNVSLEDPAVKHKLHALLKNVLELVLRKIGFSSLQPFVLANLPDD